MSQLGERIRTFSDFGSILRDCVLGVVSQSNLHKVIYGAIEASLAHNPWFIRQHVNYALNALGQMLNEKSLEKWVSKYTILKSSENEPLNVGVIMASNIPAVGFHDFLCVLMAGCRFTGKLSSDDTFLLPAFAKVLSELDEEFSSLISFTADKFFDADIVIATGSDNTARYFDYQYGKLPHIFRKNRNGIAILTGNETQDDFLGLSKDVFTHFGLGCRNVSKIYVPFNFDFEPLLNQLQAESYVQTHQPYMNNYRYKKAIYGLQNIPHYDNGHLLLTESKTFSSPVAVLHYEYYGEMVDLESELQLHKEDIQCIVISTETIIPSNHFGETQQPKPEDYADGIDTMEFITGYLKQRN